MHTNEHGSDRPSASAVVSYDLVMGEQMEFVEGTYRLTGGDWQVFIFSGRDVPEPAWTFCTWDSGVGGLVVRWPCPSPLNMAVVERTLSAALGVTRWRRVRGPDSMGLR